MLLRSSLVLVSLLGCVSLVVFGTTSFGAPSVRLGQEAQEVEHKIHEQHFVRNDADVEKPVSFVACSTFAQFEAIFGYAVTGLGRAPEPKFVTAETFEDRIVVATILHGDSLPTLDQVKTEVVGETLRVSYRLRPGRKETAFYAVPLIVSVPKGTIKTVEFIANGEKAGEATLAEE